MWSKKEKDIARRAFRMALEKEGLGLLSELKEMATIARNRGDIWRIHDFLTVRRKDIDQKYDYRYSVLISVFSRLIREGWIGIDELEGLDKDKIAKIKILAGLE
jgi:hypothetical protein